MGIINIEDRRANSVGTNKPNRISSEYLNNPMGRRVGVRCEARRRFDGVAGEPRNSRIKGSRRYSVRVPLISPAGPRANAILLFADSTDVTEAID